MNTLLNVLLSSVLLAGVYFILSLGLNIILGVLDIVNFAHGALIILGAYSTYVLHTHLSLDPFLAVLADMVVVGVIGAVVYLGYLRFTVNSPLVRMFALIGFSSVVSALLLMAFGSDYRTIPVDLGTWYLGSIPVRVSQVVAFVFAAALGGATMLVLYRTTLGKAVRAVTDDRTSVQLVGINDRRLSLLAFTVGAGLAGAAGGIIATYVTFASDSGLAFAIIAFAIVIIGGLGDIWGGAIASFLVALLLTAVTVYLSSALVNTALFLLVLMVLLLRPRGVLNRGRV
ncbi:branched-chain amino acid ABC transporter permease [Phycicoccus endophyticus]|uniref:Branched-chain amino acid ABC transporter permease n=1 Tax=Phycicoccus endophyticus TaxID=1690220 RepID=A0A7G9QZC8_9MICO|nr:branched-chain amino acid ABC transporter permease [Phycicoccus endophyticus]NHI19058.1 branched-chain amino acid ABC transporter permease [Phycicoccus endophyticus]QNN48703.1 branched-chain amino acid ABC transporter permease [Phycicoccus endophyticus]GGL32532.1 branched-chain amino acid ABC transporter permease [Phycicoccus endophyticus]